MLCCKLQSFLCLTTFTMPTPLIGTQTRQKADGSVGKMMNHASIYTELCPLLIYYNYNYLWWHWDLWGTPVPGAPTHAIPEADPEIFWECNYNIILAIHYIFLKGVTSQKGDPDSLWMHINTMKMVWYGIENALGSL